MIMLGWYCMCQVMLVVQSWWHTLYIYSVKNWVFGGLQ
jgi:hypothetical protein